MALYEHRAFQKRQMTLGLLLLGDASVPTLLERARLAEETGCDADGRAILGIGAGISGFAELGINRRKPARAIRERIDVIRALLRGETADFHGEVITSLRRRCSQVLRHT